VILQSDNVPAADKLWWEKFAEYGPDGRKKDAAGIGGGWPLVRTGTGPIFDRAPRGSGRLFLIVAVLAQLAVQGSGPDITKRFGPNAPKKPWFGP